jgi:methionyl-tRNA formyltransferase
MPKYRIVFFGTPDLSKEILQFLASLQHIEIVGVVCSPDAPIGRKQILTPCSVKCFAQSQNIAVITPNSLRDEKITPPAPLKKRGEKSPPDKGDKGGFSEDSSIHDFLKALNADFFIIVAYGKILPRSILDIPRFGSYNLHFSLLPKYRGASPVQSAILEGETISGITIFRLTEGLDEGDIMLQKEVSIKEKYADEVFAIMQEMGKEAFQEFFQNFQTLTPLPQQGHASFCKKFRREDGEIFPHKESTTEILQKIRAFSPWPGTFFIDKKTNKRIKILRAQEAQNIFEKNITGEIFFYSGECFLKTKDGNILFEVLQPEGKKSLSGKEFFAGYQNS